MSPLRRLTLLLLTVVAIAFVAPTVSAQYETDPPTGYMPKDEPAPDPPASAGRRVLEAICWYLPNRIVDIADIFHLYLTAGDGLGITVRATQLLWASWFEDDAYGIGWDPRKPPIFGESVSERYFGFLFASQGDIDRDPTEIGLSLHFVYLGLNAAVSLGEAVDALLGFAGIDLMADDHGPMLFESAEPAPEPAAQPTALWIEQPARDPGRAVSMP
ncbi:MAG TPA: hypothetical protein PLS90_12910 [Candidatus Sumerlaeota bacterium]|nr:hypothetical protein [Candidatus Sumerlaeota bacterium]